MRECQFVCVGHAQTNKRPYIMAVNPGTASHRARARIQSNNFTRHILMCHSKWVSRRAGPSVSFPCGRASETQAMGRAHTLRAVCHSFTERTRWRAGAHYTPHNALYFVCFALVLVSRLTRLRVCIRLCVMCYYDDTWQWARTSLTF